jgi:ABC-type lipoprotein export system ATPase subunit
MEYKETGYDMLKFLLSNNKLQFSKSCVLVFSIFISDILAQYLNIMFSTTLSDNYMLVFLFSMSLCRITSALINSYFNYHVERYIKIPCRQILMKHILSTFIDTSFETIEQMQGPKIQGPLEQGTNAVLSIYSRIFQALYTLLRINLSICTIYYISSGSCTLLLIMSLIFFNMHHDTLRLNSRLSKDLQKTHIKDNNKVSNFYKQIYDMVLCNKSDYIGDYICNIMYSHDMDKVPIFIKNSIYDVKLKMFHIISVFIVISYHIYNNCIIENNSDCKTVILILYQTVTTFVYQIDYCIHMYNGYLLFEVEYDPLYQLINNIKTSRIIYPKYKLSDKFKIIIKKLCYNRSNIDENRNKYTIMLYNDLILESGKRYLIKGESGNGKTTLMRVLAGVVEENDIITQDIILYNNNEVCTLHYGFMSLSPDIIYISQNTYLPYEHRTLYEIFTGYNEDPILKLNVNNQLSQTNKDSLIYDRNINRINYILQNIVNIDDIIAGINSDKYLHIEFDSKSLSGGQERRLIIIFWLYQILCGKYKIIIFDEPDRGLGVLAEKIITNICNAELFKNVVIIIVAHYPIKESIFNNTIYINRIDNEGIIRFS